MDAERTVSPLKPLRDPLDRDDRHREGLTRPAYRPAEQGHPADRAPLPGVLNDPCGGRLLVGTRDFPLLARLSRRLLRPIRRNEVGGRLRGLGRLGFRVGNLCSGRGQFRLGLLQFRDRHASQTADHSHRAALQPSHHHQLAGNPRFTRCITLRATNNSSRHHPCGWLDRESSQILRTAPHHPRLE